MVALDVVKEGAGRQRGRSRSGESSCGTVSRGRLFGNGLRPWPPQKKEDLAHI